MTPLLMTAIAAAFIIGLTGPIAYDGDLGSLFLMILLSSVATFLCLAYYFSCGASSTLMYVLTICSCCMTSFMLAFLVRGILECVKDWLRK